VSALKDPVECYKSALACDPVSAFGGIVSCNFKVNKKLALELQKLFLEVIIGNNFDAEALKILRKKKNLRLIDASKFYTNEVLKFTSANQDILTFNQRITKYLQKKISK
jgi:phosphoribosylaminoimidazolecarboxamide formyltransferase/IMP cyclohydrolase